MSSIPVHLKKNNQGPNPIQMCTSSHTPSHAHNWHNPRVVTTENKVIICCLFWFFYICHKSLRPTWKFTINKNMQLDDFPSAKEWFNWSLRTSVLKIHKGELLGIDTHAYCKTGLVPWAKYKSFVNLIHFLRRQHGGGNNLSHNFQTTFPYCHSEKLPGLSRVVYT